MGAALAAYVARTPAIRAFISRKRAHSLDVIFDKAVLPPKRSYICGQGVAQRRKLKKKLLSTPKYIYQALFKDGANSDVTVIMLKKEWKLHKVYLCQSPYFASMFSGSWKESDENCISIEIVDPKITEMSLYIVLGSLYCNEVELDVDQLVPILATAAHFQLDSVAERCSEVMNEIMDIENVLEYYDAAVEYGVPSVKDGALRWLQANLLTHVIYFPHILAAIRADLMRGLVDSPTLFVVQSESCVYFMLQLWLYFSTNTSSLTSSSPLTAAQYQQAIEKSSEFFQSFEGTSSYLERDEGKPYLEPFKALRLKYLINLHDDMQRIQLNRVIPRVWLQEASSQAWASMLRVDKVLDVGPKEFTEQQVSECSLRCGRLIPNASEHVWRWTGFHSGLDLVWTFNHGTVKVRRNHRGNDGVALLSMTERRHIVCRITIATLNDHRQVKVKKSSEIQKLSFLRHQEVTVLQVKGLTYPSFLLAELLLTTPESNMT